MTEAQRNIGKAVRLTQGLRAVASAAAGSFGLTGVSINREGVHSALIKVSTGASTGTPATIAVDAKLQESDDGSSWTDVATSVQNTAVAITQITAVNTDRWLAIDLSGLKKFVRMAHQVAFTGGTSPTIVVDSEFVLGGAPLKPTVQS